MRVLIVEDDQHKSDDLIQFIRSVWSEWELTHKRSVRDGVIAIVEDNYDLLILDMALPTFSQNKSASGGLNQPQGGLELIRMMVQLKKRIGIIFFTQYPMIEIDNEYVEVNAAVSQLVKRYGVDVRGAVLYRFGDSAWMESLLSIVEKDCADAGSG